MSASPLKADMRELPRIGPFRAKSGHMQRSKKAPLFYHVGRAGEHGHRPSGLAAVSVSRLIMSSELAGAGTEPLHSPAAQPIDRAA
jgi:hypothetical protein